MNKLKPLNIVDDRPHEPDFDAVQGAEELRALADLVVDVSKELAMSTPTARARAEQLRDELRSWKLSFYEDGQTDAILAYADEIRREPRERGEWEPLAQAAVHRAFDAFIQQDAFLPAGWNPMPMLTRLRDSILAEMPLPPPAPPAEGRTE